MDTKPKDEMVANPSTEFEKPKSLIKDSDLSHQDKRQALDTGTGCSTAHDSKYEGMPGKEEGLKVNGDNLLGEVVRAKDKIGEKPTPKPSQ
jgi:hypothetical protein